MSSFIDKILNNETVFNRAITKNGRRVGDRKVIDTTQIPYRWICKIYAHFTDNTINLLTGQPNKTITSSGLLISPKAVLTAAHALIKVRADNGMIERAFRIEIIPGFKGNRFNHPFGSYTTSNFHLSQDYISKFSRSNWHNIVQKTNRAFDFDYALIKLRRDIGNRRFPKIGIRLGWWNSSHKCFIKPVDSHCIIDLRNRVVNVGGYPNDMPNKQVIGFDIVKKVNSKSITYYTDTFNGQSGSPIYVKNDAGKRFLIGIHVASAKNDNRGVLITNDMIRNFDIWGIKNQLSFSKFKNDCKK